MDCWCQAGKASRRRQEKGGLRYGWSIGKGWAGKGGWWGKRPGKQGQSAEEALEGEGRAECPFQGAFICSNTEKHIPLQAGVDYLLPGDWPANWAAAAGHPGWGWGVGPATWGRASWDTWKSGGEGLLKVPVPSFIQQMLRRLCSRPETGMEQHTGCWDVILPSIKIAKPYITVHVSCTGSFWVLLVNHTRTSNTSA